MADVAGHAVAIGNRKLLASYSFELDNHAKVQDMENLWAGRGQVSTLAYPNEQYLSAFHPVVIVIEIHVSMLNAIE